MQVMEVNNVELIYEESHILDLRTTEISGKFVKHIANQQSPGVL